MFRLAPPMRSIALVCTLSLLTAGLVRAELAPIQLDGRFEDWAGVSLMASDNPNDGGTVDFADVWVANDQDYLYIRFETGGEVQPDEQQDIRLYMDTDMNAGTGTSFNGIGADLVWELGNRNGSYKGSFIDHPDIGLLIGPTVSNTEFELALSRDAAPNGALFPGSQLRFVLRDAVSGDTVPNSGGITYTFTAGSDVAPTLSLTKADPEDIRVACWNVQNDGLFDGGSSEAAQNRLLDAIDPDVLVLCEVWNHDANQTANIIEQHLPSGAGENWYSIKRDSGNVIVSRFPIDSSWEVNPGYRITAALLDLGAEYPSDLLVIANHWRCCTADDDRQEEADSVIEFLADARTPGGVITLPADTPIVLGGDFNLVGWRQQLETILTGDIINQGLYGPDSAPDWDGTDLAAPASRHPDGRAGDTWRNPFSSFYPGVLDWIFYTDSATTLKNHFILETRTMLPATLAANGLISGDTFTASDHAPRVADFSLVDPASSVPELQGRAHGARLLPNTPNPFNPATQLRFELMHTAEVELSVYDARGHLVRGFVVGRREAGAHSVRWDGADRNGQPVASGVYHVQLVTRVGGEVARDMQSVVLVE